MVFFSHGGIKSKHPAAMFDHFFIKGKVIPCSIRNQQQVNILILLKFKVLNFFKSFKENVATCKRKFNLALIVSWRQARTVEVISLITVEKRQVVRTANKKIGNDIRSQGDLKEKTNKLYGQQYGMSNEGLSYCKRNPETTWASKGFEHGNLSC